MTSEVLRRYKHIKPPTLVGSYAPRDCIFLLKNINGLIHEQNNLEREQAIQEGVHYSEMLPIEYQPKANYIQVYEKMLQDSAYQLAYDIGVLSELILKDKGYETVLVSLARAGTPIGILIKRYLFEKYHLDLPHYSVSIIRGKGIDENAILYILGKHQHTSIQFIDGWTGKGAIFNSLKKACQTLEEAYKITLDHHLAVLYDPGHCAKLYATREDRLVPSACLNATISGLISRTVLREDLIGENEFHGVKYYEKWKKNDLSNHFIETISKHFRTIDIKKEDIGPREALSFQGMEDVQRIGTLFGIEDINRIKPGIGETTRVLLRRLPWKILVKDKQDPNLKHILILAEDKKIPVEVYTQMSYACCGLIKNMKT